MKQVWLIPPRFLLQIVFIMVFVLAGIQPSSPVWSLPGDARSSGSQISPHVSMSLGPARPFRPIDPENLPFRSIYHKSKIATEKISTSSRRTLDVRVESVPFGDADLGETVDVQITADIVALANQLGNDPLWIFGHIRNHFEFEPFYAGSLKGSQETFLQRAGNDYDLASLLIALLRAAGIQSRYARGSVRIPIDEAMSWVGVTDAQTAGDILTTAGYDVTLLTQNGTITALQLSRVWVEASLPSGGQMVPVVFDPAFKMHTLQPGRNLVEEAGLSGEDLLNAILDNSTADPAIPVLSDVQIGVVETLIKERQQAILTYLEQNEPGLTLHGVLRQKQIVEETVNGLPSQLPYELQGTVERFSEIPATERHTIRFQMTGLNTTLPLPEIASKRITLSFAAATPSDQDIIDSFGGILRTPPRAARLIPQIKVAGEVKAQGFGLQLGDAFPFTLVFQQGFRPLGAVTHDITVGGHYAVALDTQTVSPEKIQRAMDGLIAASAAAGDDVLRDDVMGALLHTLGMIFFGYQDRLVEYAAGTQNAVALHLVNEALISQDLRVAEVDGAPVMALDGLGVDTPRNLFGLFSSTGDPNFDIMPLMSMLAYGTSNFEEGIFRRALGWPSTSTTSFFQEAADNEIPIFAITQDNINHILPQLDITGEIEGHIRTSITQGLHVLVPQQPLQLLSWEGLGWIAFDPITGAAGYFISGGIAGGNTILEGGVSVDAQIRVSP